MTCCCYGAQSREFRADSRTTSSSRTLVWNQSWIKSLPKQTQHNQILWQCKNLTSAECPQVSSPAPFFNKSALQSVPEPTTVCISTPKVNSIALKILLTMLICFVLLHVHFHLCIILHSPKQTQPKNQVKLHQYTIPNYCGHPYCLSLETSLHTHSMLPTDSSWHLCVPIQSLLKMSRIWQVILLPLCERYHVSPKKPYEQYLSCTLALFLISSILGAGINWNQVPTVLISPPWNTELGNKIAI